MKLAEMQGGFRKVLSPLISGELTEPPFPEDATKRIRDFMLGVVPKVTIPEDAKDQPVDIELLHRLLVLAEDPDAEAMQLYYVGVPIGVGVEMPRTKTVFPPKVRWSLKEQFDWGGDSVKAAAFSGKRRSNYPSAETFATEVERALVDQANRGQILIMPFDDAVRKFGTKLAIASLAALEKGTDQDGKRGGPHHPRWHERGGC